MHAFLCFINCLMAEQQHDMNELESEQLCIYDKYFIFPDRNNPRSFKTAIILCSSNCFTTGKDGAVKNFKNTPGYCGENPKIGTFLFHQIYTDVNYIHRKLKEHQ